MTWWSRKVSRLCASPSLLEKGGRVAATTSRDRPARANVPPTQGMRADAAVVVAAQRSAGRDGRKGMYGPNQELFCASSRLAQEEGGSSREEEGGRKMGGLNGGGGGGGKAIMVNS